MSEENKAAWEINPQRTAEGEVMICGGEPYGLVAVVTTEEDAALIVRAVNGVGEVEAMRQRIRVLEDALECFASERNWRQGGPCDPNSPSFGGIGIATAALSRGEG